MVGFVILNSLGSNSHSCGPGLYVESLKVMKEREDTTSLSPHNYCHLFRDVVHTEVAKSPNRSTNVVPEAHF